MSRDLSIKYGDIAIDIDDNSVKSYLKFQMLHLNRFRQEIKEITDVVDKDNMPDDYSKFLRSLAKYEYQHQYKYDKSTYKTICAARIELLLPRKIKNLSQKKVLLRKFINAINPIDYRLPWIAYEITRGTAKLLVILISEREFIDREDYKVYNRNYYDANGVVTHKKGEIMHDKKGKPIKTHTLWSNKVRIFSFSRSQFKRLIQDLMDKYIIAIKQVIKKISKRFCIKKKNAKAKWHYYNRKCIYEINTLKQYIEFHCNYAMSLQREIVYDPHMEDVTARAAPTPKANEIIALFHKYKARFEKNSFHDKKGLLRAIPYKRLSLPTLQDNLSILKDEFRSELASIVPTVFKSIS